MKINLTICLLGVVLNATVTFIPILDDSLKVIICFIITSIVLSSVIVLMIVAKDKENQHNNDNVLTAEQTKTEETPRRIENEVMLKHRTECKMLDKAINEAKVEIFISGLSLVTLSGYASTLKQLNLRIRLVIMDNSDPKLVDVFKTMRGDKSTRTDLSHLSVFSDEKHIEIRAIDSVMPATFVAMDMNTKMGCIKVEHYINMADSTERPNIVLTNENGEWYKIYQEQIEKIWESAYPINF